MKNIIRSAAARTQEFVTDHKTAITIAATATVTFMATAAASRALTKDFKNTVDEFLTEHSLKDEFDNLFYDPTEDVPVS